jgi:iron complex outermembrane receptor protein
MKKLIQILVYISFLLLSNRMIAINPENLSGSLTGKITDKKTGDLMPGVNVYLPDLKTGTISDKDGMNMIEYRCIYN